MDRGPATVNVAGPLCVLTLAMTRHHNRLARLAETRPISDAVRPAGEAADPDGLPGMAVSPAAVFRG
ncbi:hypothetical protein FHS01_002060 [Longimicrobium terrae]|uniref:Uncharacterized protein n=1 Tax=Longimicrobium terrae TaxID=1639882 RepID=A0A841GUH9_9BACT|nr:hypothetical protein [Longimicrobium terrae]MBB6070439.1 hypothetical protein [Longimicrobium terrae]